MVDESSPNHKPMSPSFLCSPRLIFNGLLPKSLSNLNTTKNITCSNHFESEAIGLAMIDEQEKTYDDDSISNKPLSRMALFGSKLIKVQIPTTADQPSSTPPESPADFGIKTIKNIINIHNSSSSSSQGAGTPSKELFSRQLSLKEMELSEDYTCVITHGPRPKTTHIFDDCIVVECIGYEHGQEEDLNLHEREPFASMNAERDIWKPIKTREFDDITDLFQ